MLHIAQKIPEAIKTTVFAATALILVVSGQVTAAALESNRIYVTDRNSLYLVDEVTGAASVVAEADPPLGQIEDIAFDGSTLYGLSGLMQVFTYNASSAKMEAQNNYTSFALQHYGLEAFGGMVFAAENNLLMRLDPATNTFSDVGSGYGLGAGETVNDLAFDESGILYASVSVSGQPDLLGVLDPVNGTLVLLGSTGVSGLRAITVKDGILYGMSSVGDLYTLSRFNGFATMIHASVVPGAYGMETSPANLSVGGAGSGTGGGSGDDSGSSAMSLPVLLAILGLVSLRLLRKRAV